MKNPGMIHPLDGWAPVQRTCAQDKLIIGQYLPRGRNRSVVPVDGLHVGPRQHLDLVGFIESFRTDQLHRGTARWIQLGFRQRWAMVGQGGFISNQGDGAFPASLAERGAQLRGSVSRSHN